MQAGAAAVNSSKRAAAAATKVGAAYMPAATDGEPKRTSVADDTAVHHSADVSCPTNDGGRTAMALNLRLEVPLELSVVYRRRDAYVTAMEWIAEFADQRATTPTEDASAAGIAAELAEAAAGAVGELADSAVEAAEAGINAAAEAGINATEEAVGRRCLSHGAPLPIAFET